MRFLLCLIIIKIGVLHPCYSQQGKRPPSKFDAKVVRVWDGDTLDVLYKDSTYRIRLYGIDAPEAGQDFYKESKQYLSILSS